MNISLRAIFGNFSIAASGDVRMLKVEILLKLGEVGETLMGKLSVIDAITATTGLSRWCRARTAFW